MTMHPARARRKRGPKLLPLDAFVGDAAPNTMLASDGTPLEPYAGQACTCVLVPRMLRDLGATRAAKMHKKGGDSGTAEEMVDAWKGHLSDEEKYYFPMLLRVAKVMDAKGKVEAADGIRAAVARLGREHGELRKNYLDRGIVPPAAVTRAHGVVEDAYIILYEPEMRALLRQDARKAA